MNAKTKINNQFSIVLPSFNGGEFIDRFFDSLLTQERLSDVRSLIICDSGSTDDTVDKIKTFIAKHKSELPIEFSTMQNSDYGHGKTRQKLLEKVKSPFVVYVVQDCAFVDEDALGALVDACSIDSRIAASYAYHFANPDARAMTKRLTHKTFEDSKKYMAQFESYKQLDGDIHLLRSSADVMRWKEMSAFSNVLACYRTEILRKVPFQDVDFAEDRLFVRDVAEAGWGIAYAESSKIYHSHDYTLVGTFKRRFDEIMALEKTGTLERRSLPRVLRNTCTGAFKDVLYAWRTQRVSILEKLRVLVYALPFEFAYNIGEYYGARHESLSEEDLRKFSHQHSWRDS